MKTSREAFEEWYVDSLNKRGVDPDDIAWIILSFKRGDCPDCIEWEAWQAACKFADGMED